MSNLIVKVCKVEKVEKHPNADRLSIVTVKGWNCITGLDEYREGDLVVFIPPDCILPDDLIEKYKLEYLKKNGRTGTIKLRGYVSQGLILPVSCLPETSVFIEGDNVAVALGIKKYEVPEPPKIKGVSQVSKKKLNPYFDKYTEIENIKHYPDVFQDGEQVVITEKIHGSNARYARLKISNSGHSLFNRIKYWWKRYILRETSEFVYGSHNIQISGRLNKKTFYGEDIWGQIAKKYDLANKIPEDTIIYGEIYGKGIQDLTYGLDDIDLIVFDIKRKECEGFAYIDWAFTKYLCKLWGLKCVPELYSGAYLEEIAKQCTIGNSLLDPTQIREGCVIRSATETNHPKIGRKILKSISEEYLLRKGGTEFK